jgi:hypothetical protein
MGRRSRSRSHSRSRSPDRRRDRDRSRERGDRHKDSRSRIRYEDSSSLKKRDHKDGGIHMVSFSDDDCTDLISKEHNVDRSSRRNSFERRPDRGKSRSMSRDRTESRSHSSRSSSSSSRGLLLLLPKLGPCSISKGISIIASSSHRTVFVSGLLWDAPTSAFKITLRDVFVSLPFHVDILPQYAALTRRQGLTPFEASSTQRIFELQRFLLICKRLRLIDRKTQ